MRPLLSDRLAVALPISALILCLCGGLLWHGTDVPAWVGIGLLGGGILLAFCAAVAAVVDAQDALDDEDGDELQAKALPSDLLDLQGPGPMLRALVARLHGQHRFRTRRQLYLAAVAAAVDAELVADDERGRRQVRVVIDQYAGQCADLPA